MRKSFWMTAFCLCSFIVLQGCADRQERHSTTLANTQAALPLDVGISLPLDLQVTVTELEPTTNVAQIHVDFTSKFEQAKVKITIVLPKDAEWQSGNAIWEGELKAGQTGQMDFALRLKDTKPGFVIAKAAIVADGRNYSQGASAYLDPEQRLQKQAQTRAVQGYKNVESIHVHRAKVSQ